MCHYVEVECHNCGGTGNVLVPAKPGGVCESVGCGGTIVPCEWCRGKGKIGGIACPNAMGEPGTPGVTGGP